MKKRVKLVKQPLVVHQQNKSLARMNSSRDMFFFVSLLILVGALTAWLVYRQNNSGSDVVNTTVTTTSKTPDTPDIPAPDAPKSGTVATFFSWLWKIVLVILVILFLGGVFFIYHADAMLLQRDARRSIEHLMKFIKQNRRMPDEQRKHLDALIAFRSELEKTNVVQAFAQIAHRLKPEDKKRLIDLLSGETMLTDAKSVFDEQKWKEEMTSIKIAINKAMDMDIDQHAINNAFDKLDMTRGEPRV